MNRTVQAVLQAAVGALSGALAYSIQATLSHPRSANLFSPLMLPLLVPIALSALVTTIASMLLLRLSVRWGWPASALASAAALGASYPAFVWYMRANSPSVAWERAWLLPLTAASVTILLFWLDWPRAERKAR